MKCNNLIHNWIILFVVGLSMCSLCISYAATVDTKTANDIKIQNLNFTFPEEYKNDFLIKLITNADNENNISDLKHNKRQVTPLDAFMEYNDKTLNISGVEAFVLEDLQNGKVSLAIDYLMLHGKKQDKAANVSIGIYGLGNIPFFLSLDEPYWRLSNSQGVWGIGIPDIGIPDEIYKLIPENLSDLYGYNTITSYNNGVVKGSITIGKFITGMSKTPEINLSSLGLSNEINQEIIANKEESSTLEIMANYYFSVPFGLNKETSEEILEPTQAISYDVLTNRPKVQGKITLKSYIKVIHDIKPTQEKEANN